MLIKLETTEIALLSDKVATPVFNMWQRGTKTKHNNLCG